MAWQRLDDRFGNSTALMNKVRSELQGPMIKDWDGAELTKLRDRVFNCKTVYEACGRLSELNSQDVLMKLFEITAQDKGAVRSTGAQWHRDLFRIAETCRYCC